MRYSRKKRETRLDRLLATRVRDLGGYLRRLLGLDRIQWSKYEFDLAPGFDAGDIETIAYGTRGRDYRPAIFVHGVLPRSGTNYLADLLERHQDVHAHPHRFWEFPLLSVTDRVEELQADFARVYRRNAEVLKPFEFAACLASGLMRHLQELVGPDKTMLFKFPYVHYVSLFRLLFPQDYLILLLRDGRDVVSSSMKTFQKGFFISRFSNYCVEWDCAARTILKYDGGGPKKHPRTLVVKYEDLFSSPGESIRAILRRVGLESARYDFADIGNMPVRGSSDLAEHAGGIHWKPQSRQEKFNPVGRWKDWPERRKRRFKAKAGDTLIAAGYAVSNEW